LQFLSATATVDSSDSACGDGISKPRHEIELGSLVCAKGSLALYESNEDEYGLAIVVAMIDAVDDPNYEMFSWLGAMEMDMAIKEEEGPESGQGKRPVLEESTNSTA
jgi:hypothetical protein